MSVNALSPLDEERIRVQHLQPTEVLPLPPPRSSDACSLEPCKGTETLNSRPARPQLEIPNLNWTLASFYMRDEQLNAKHAQGINTDFNQNTHEINQAWEMRQKKVQDLEKERSGKTWGAFSDVLQFLASATSLSIGLVYIANGNLREGSSFLVAGGIALFSTMSRNVDLYQTVASYLVRSAEAQEKWANFTELTMTALSLGIMVGVGGGFLAYEANRLEIIRQAFGNREALQTGLQFMSTSTQLRAGLLKKKACELQQQLDQLKYEIDRVQQNKQETCEQARRIPEELQNLFKQLKNTIEMSAKAAEAA